VTGRLQMPPSQGTLSQQLPLVAQAPPRPAQHRDPDNPEIAPQRRSRQHSVESPEQTCWTS
jgi:hypothetical protein